MTTSSLRRGRKIGRVRTNRDVLGLGDHVAQLKLCPSLDSLADLHSHSVTSDVYTS
jgi:hypothetical protein